MPIPPNAEQLVAESVEELAVYIRKELTTTDPNKRSLQAGVLFKEINHRRKKRRVSWEDIWTALFANFVREAEVSPFVLDPNKCQVDIFPPLLYCLEKEDRTGDFTIKLGLKLWQEKFRGLNAAQKATEVSRLSDWIESFAALNAYLLYKKNRGCFTPDLFQSLVNTLITRTKNEVPDSLHNKAFRDGLDSLRTKHSKTISDWDAAHLGKEKSGDWEYPMLDVWLFLVWPLVKRFNYTNKELSWMITDHLQKILRVDLNKYPCKSPDDLSQHCRLVLGLRHEERPKGRPERSGKISDIPRLELALMLWLEVP